MKQRLKHLVPLLAIFVPLWGLLSLDADHLVGMLDHGSNQTRDLESLPNLLLEAENLLRD